MCKDELALLVREAVAALWVAPVSATVQSPAPQGFFMNASALVVDGRIWPGALRAHDLGATRMGSIGVNHKEEEAEGCADIRWSSVARTYQSLRIPNATGGSGAQCLVNNSA
jgi:hypothetical protein